MEIFTGGSQYTIDFYNVSCRTFSKFVDTAELKVMDITRDLIDDYILYLRDTCIKDVTINTYLLRQVFLFNKIRLLNRGLTLQGDLYAFLRGI